MSGSPYRRRKTHILTTAPLIIYGEVDIPRRRLAPRPPVGAAHHGARRGRHRPDHILQRCASSLSHPPSTFAAPRPFRKSEADSIVQTTASRTTSGPSRARSPTRKRGSTASRTGHGSSSLHTSPARSRRACIPRSTGTGSSCGRARTSGTRRRRTTRCRGRIGGSW